ncbi:TetR/AcrR family transcriptional regulator (plasmid) [Polymorphobacter sp. PAMC 29334]|uniref:TetR/AcrR family transcriptional regulator n=1 Tax=Polymorphobacter sp. PAMC 29334 TaxID=2862331 RepID=UPI001C673148|nr:TetR/AcrR family transcriptional regulator [Polymorphobacter sp. PAMC 29334]QYE37101.1 TetR/AcrR family transcriptional regulator [Polymorphobacter sp. PAMC 29334]
MEERSPRVSSNNAKRARTRARLTDAALRLMSERGISATSVSEIAAEAELANGTFYLYFQDKAEIVAVVCQAVTRAMHDDMTGKRLSLEDGAARVAFGTQQFIEIAAAEPVWGRLLVSAFTEFGSIKEDVSHYMRMDVALGIEQSRFAEPLDEFVIDAHLAILRAGVIARLAGAGPDVSARAAEYQLRILGMSVAEARRVRDAVEGVGDVSEPD